MAARRRLAPRALPRGRRPYALRGLIWCSECQRRLEAKTVGSRRYYQCRFAASDHYGRNPELEATHPTTHLAERYVLPAINGWLAEVFDPENLDRTVKALAAAAAAEEGPNEQQADQWRRRLAKAQTQEARYRAMVDNGTAPIEVVGRWLTDNEEERLRAEAEICRLTPIGPPSVDEIRQLIVRLGSIVARLNQADPAKLNEAYTSLGLRVTWQPGTRVVDVDVADPCVEPRVARPR